MKTHVKFHRIAIYDLRLWVGVADNIDELHKKFAWAFGPNPGGQAACLSFHGSKFALFFERKWLCHETVGHEVWHATNRMMEFAGHYAGSGPNEPHAYLNGHVAGLVYQDFINWREPVRKASRETPIRFSTFNTFP